MDDAAGVRVRERRRDGGAELPRLVPRPRPAGETRVERLALDELHDEHRLAAVLEDVVEAHDVRVLEPRQRRRLALEPLTELGIVGDPGVEDLDRDDAAETQVAGAPDDAHPAPAELLQWAIAP